jgi:phage gpG-like protein
VADADISGTLEALTALQKRIREATQVSGDKGAEVIADAIKQKLGQREYPPAAPIGEPPAKRSGDLQASVTWRELSSDSGIMERIYPSTAYARIHELSGWAGAGHRSFIPKRPYVGPVRDDPDTLNKARGVFVDGWREAIPGR